MAKRLGLVAVIAAALSACSVAKTAGSAVVTTGQVALGVADLAL